MRFEQKYFESSLVADSQGVGRFDCEGAVVVSLKGPLHIERLQESLNRALLKHPALRAKLLIPDVSPKKTKDKSKSLGTGWKVEHGASVPFKLAALDRLAADAAKSLFVSPIDLTQDCPVRVSLLQVSKAENVLRLDFHGALCDGPAALRYIDDVMSAYAFEHGVEQRVEAERFGDRNMLCETSWWQTARCLFWLGATLWSTLTASLRFGSHRRKGPASKSSSSFASVYGPVRTFQLTADQSATFEAVGRRYGGQVSDVVLRDVALAVKAGTGAQPAFWNGDVFVEVNQRQGADSRVPQAHLTSLSWLHLNFFPWTDRSAALRRIVWITGQDGLARLSPQNFPFVRGVWRFFRRCFTQLKGVIPYPIVFFDAGVPFASTFLPRDGDGAVVARGVRVESISCVPSLWGMGGLGIGVVHYRRALRFAIQGDPDLLAPQIMERLMDRFEEQLYETASEPGRESLALDALIEAHARISQAHTPLRSLPIGKHVTPDAPRLRDPRSSSGLSVAEGTRAGELPRAAETSPTGVVLEG